MLGVGKWGVWWWQGGGGDVRDGAGRGYGLLGREGGGGVLWIGNWGERKFVGGGWATRVRSDLLQRREGISS